MISFNSLKHSVYRATLLENFSVFPEEDRTELKIITAALTIDTIKKIANSIEGTIASTISSYLKTYKGIVSGLNGVYLSYRKLIQYIRNHDEIITVLNLTQSNINEIVNIYNDRTNIRTFNLNSYSEKMYDINTLSPRDNDTLKNIHFEVICKIVDYYLEKNHISYSDVKLELSKYESPREIYLSIRGIDENQLYSDIDKDIFGIKKFLYSFKIDDKKRIELFIK